MFEKARLRTQAGIEKGPARALFCLFSSEI